MKFDEEKQDLECVIKWVHKLPIEDADMSVMTTQWSKNKPNNSHIVCSFKKQYVNTYNILVIDLNTKNIEFWHESYALYEAEITGFHCADDDFMILNRFGMYIVTLKRDQIVPRKVKTS